jgi:hypothetical protein
LFGREPRTKLPETNEVVPKHPDDDVLRKRDFEQKMKMKDYADAKFQAKSTPMEKGEIVLLKQQRQVKTDTSYNPQPLIVKTQKGSMITATYPDGKEVTRNKSRFKVFPHADPESLILEKHEPEIEMSSKHNQTQGEIEEVEQGEKARLEKRQDLSLARNRPKRNVKRPERLIESY